MILSQTLASLTSPEYLFGSVRIEIKQLSGHTTYVFRWLRTFPFPNLIKQLLKIAVIDACLESKLDGRTLKFIFFTRGPLKTRQSTTLAPILLKQVKFQSLSPGVWPFASSRLWLLQIVNNYLPEVFTLTSQEHLLLVSKVVPSMSGSR